MKTFAMFGVLVMVLGAFTGLAQGMGPLDGLSAKGDNDRDGLTNAQEYVWGTDPNDPDSDGDGCYDGWEIWYDTHRATDKDQNVIIDSNYHFDANFAGDAGKVAEPHNLIQVGDGDVNILTNDPDGDGWNNLHEFMVGSDPTNPNTDGDSYVKDSTDPDPLIFNDVGGTGDGNGGPGSGHGNMGGNGGGGSGIGQVANIL
jgi:hypothetical protein